MPIRSIAQSNQPFPEMGSPLKQAPQISSNHSTINTIKASSQLPLNIDQLSLPQTEKANDILKLSDLSNSQNDLNNYFGLSQIVAYSTENNRIYNIAEATPEQLEQAVKEGNVGTVKEENGKQVFSFSGKLAEEIQAKQEQGESIAYHKADGSQVSLARGSFEVRALSDQELDQLISKTKVYIAFLKAIQKPNASDEEDKKVDEEIQKYEQLLRALQDQRGVHKGADEIFIEFLATAVLDAKIRGMANRIVKLIIARMEEDKDIQARRKSEENNKAYIHAMDEKHAITKMEVKRDQLKNETVHENTLESEVGRIEGVAPFLLPGSQASHGG